MIDRLFGWWYERREGECGGVGARLRGRERERERGRKNVSARGNKRINNK